LYFARINEAPGAKAQASKLIYTVVPDGVYGIEKGLRPDDLKMPQRSLFTFCFYSLRHGRSCILKIIRRSASLH